jgi:XisH protein
MPKLDQCHEQVVRALQKDGWAVDNKPFKLYAEDRKIFIDIRANRGINGSRQQIILVEVKCFPDKNSTTTDMYIALGQYLIYRSVLAERNVPISLYLAVSVEVLDEIFDRSARRAVSDNQIKMVAVNLETETIEQWIE